MKLDPGGDISAIGNYVSATSKSEKGKLNLFPKVTPQIPLGTLIDSINHKTLNVTTLLVS